MLVSKWAESYWAISTVKPKTLFDYKGFYRRNLDPVFGARELDDIKRYEVQSFIQGLTPHLSHKSLMLLKTLYREAIKYEVTENNPTLGVRHKKLPEPKRHFLTWEQVDAINWGKYDSQIRFLALHGLRWSEAVVLTEEDIYEDYVHINRSFYGTTKSSAGNRKIPYVGFFKPFPKSYKTLLRHVAVQGVSIHSFRRTYAYLLKKSGVHVTTAQKLLGHADPMVTLAIYTSVLDDEFDNVGELLRNKILIPSIPYGELLGLSVASSKVGVFNTNSFDDALLSKEK
jgi:integrase